MSEAKHAPEEQQGGFDSAKEIKRALKAAHADSRADAPQLGPDGPGANKPVSVVEDEDKLLGLTNQLTEGRFNAEQLGKIRAGLEERNLLTADEEDDRPQGALTHALHEAERQAGLRTDVSEAVSERGKIELPGAASPVEAATKPEPPQGPLDVPQAEQPAEAAAPLTKGERRVHRAEAAMVDVDDATTDDRLHQAEQNQGGEDADVVAREQARQQASAAHEQAGTSPEDVAAAMDEALSMDREAAAQYQVHEAYQRQIDAEPDEPMKKALRVEAQRAVDAEAERQRGATKAEAERRGALMASVAQFAAETVAKAGRGEQSVETLTNETPNAEEIALARRQALGVEPMPFLEEKKGGLLRLLAKNQGPRALESHFRVPGQDHMEVLERRNRRTGELISQTVITTKGELRSRQGGVTISAGSEGLEVKPSDKVRLLPAREVRSIADRIRQTDTARLKEKNHSRYGGSSVMDYVGGFGSPKIDGPNGVYAQQYGADAEQLRRHKADTSKRRGGFWHWISGGRI